MYLQTAKEGGEGRGLPYYMPSIKANVDKMSSYSMQAWRCVKKLKKNQSAYRIAHPFGLVRDYPFMFGAVLHGIYMNKG